MNRSSSRIFCTLTASLGLLLRGHAAEEYDLIVRNANVIDGLGRPAFTADVAVRDGRIAKVGAVPGSAARELEARGLILAPGFIDVHTHAENLDELPEADNYLRMGVTTLVLGNCGSSVLEVEPLLARLRQTHCSVNAATLVGHGTLRNQVMGGSFLRPPTSAELDEMKTRLRQGMQQGAVGLSTGLIYLPGVFAKTEELIELAKVASEFDGIYASHMRDEGEAILEALEELFRIAREARIRAQVSHIKLSGKPNWGRASEVLAAIIAARETGLEITHDLYLYTASSTGLSQLIPAEDRDDDIFAKRMADPEEKAILMTTMKRRLEQQLRGSYDYAVIAYCKSQPTLNGLNLLQAAQKVRGSDSIDDQLELLFDLHAKGGASAVFHGIQEDDLQTFLRHPHTMIAADSSVRRFEEGVPHPRGYGNNARLLRRYVRQLKQLSLEEALRRMTSLPAATFRLRDRGQIRVGAWADLVVFDPDRVQDHATFEAPHQYATGFDWVLVNGQVVIDHDRHTRARPGRVLRRDE